MKIRYPIPEVCEECSALIFEDETHVCEELSVAADTDELEVSDDD